MIRETRAFAVVEARLALTMSRAMSCIESGSGE